MDAEKQATLSRLRSQLIAELNAPGQGRVRCDVERIGDVTPQTSDERLLLVLLLRKHGLGTDATTLVDVPRPLAERVAEELFSGSCVMQMRSRSEAQAVASLFFGLFDRDARFYSTYEYAYDPKRDSLTATGRPLIDNCPSCESGFLVVDSTQVRVSDRRRRGLTLATHARCRALVERNPLGKVGRGSTQEVSDELP